MQEKIANHQEPGEVKRFKEIRLLRENLSGLSQLQDKLSEKEKTLLTHHLRNIEAHSAYIFGDHHDGVIEFAALVAGDKAVEVGYYYGDLKPKSIIKISSQAGCPFRCNFCNAGEEIFQRNLSPQEIYEQAALMLQVAASQNVPWSALSHKINFAGTGEPLLNPDLTKAIKLLAQHDLSFKVSTVFPGNKSAFDNFKCLAEFAGAYQQSVQVQVSLISTNESFRNQVAGGRLASFDEIVEAAKIWRNHDPLRSQINLSLILTEETPAEAEKIWKVFPPELFRIRFRNYMPTEYGDKNDLKTISSDRMQSIKEAFRLRGYNVRDDATPTDTEQAFSLASNVTRRRMMRALDLPIVYKLSR